jgi:hypothetical protein
MVGNDPGQHADHERDQCRRPVNPPKIHHHSATSDNPTGTARAPRTTPTATTGTASSRRTSSPATTARLERRHLEQRSTRRLLGL